MVGLNQDRSIRKIKGPHRPIHSERARARVLSALEVVDFIVLFGDKTPLKLIKVIKPDVLVKGSDWSTDKIVGAKEVLSWGGNVKRIPLLAGYSTTQTIHKLENV